MNKPRSKPILFGELQEDVREPTTDEVQRWATEQESMRKYYLEVVVNRFGKELDEMRKVRLSLLFLAFV